MDIKELQKKVIEVKGDNLIISCQAKRCESKTPMQIFRDNLPLAKQKMLSITDEHLTAAA